MPDYSNTRIQLRRGTAAGWASANTILGEGEPGFSINDNSLKIGDGVTTFSNLSGIVGVYSSPGQAGDTASTNVSGVQNIVFTDAAGYAAVSKDANTIYFVV